MTFIEFLLAMMTAVTLGANGGLAIASWEYGKRNRLLEWAALAFLIFTIGHFVKAWEVLQ